MQRLDMLVLQDYSGLDQTCCDDLSGVLGWWCARCCHMSHVVKLQHNSEQFCSLVLPYPNFPHLFILSQQLFSMGYSSGGGRETLRLRDQQTHVSPARLRHCRWERFNTPRRLSSWMFSWHILTGTPNCRWRISLRIPNLLTNQVPGHDPAAWIQTLQVFLGKNGGRHGSRGPLRCVLIWSAARASKPVEDLRVMVRPPCLSIAERIFADTHWPPVRRISFMLWDIVGKSPSGVWFSTRPQNFRVAAVALLSVWSAWT